VRALAGTAAAVGCPSSRQVTVSKSEAWDSDSLVFLCESDGEYFVINSVAMAQSDEDEGDGPPRYRGPVFQDLDDTLQQVGARPGQSAHVCARPCVLRVAPHLTCSPRLRARTPADLAPRLLRPGPQAFVDYLEERGVNAYLGDFLRAFAADKARREYRAWLERVRGFLASK
jgi:complement component 1 Q subcomponent-binding protein